MKHDWFAAFYLCCGGVQPLFTNLLSKEVIELFLSGHLRTAMKEYGLLRTAHNFSVHVQSLACVDAIMSLHRKVLCQGLESSITSFQHQESLGKITMDLLA